MTTPPGRSEPDGPSLQHPTSGLADGQAALGADGATRDVRPERVGRRRLDRPLSLADQVLSGLSNFLAIALIARSATPESFGHFAVVYALFVALLSLARRLWGTRVSMTSSPVESLEQLRRTLAATVCATPIAWAVLTIPSVVLTGAGGWPVVAVLAVALPLVVAQDLCRYGAVAAGRPAVALVSDGLWVVVVAGGYAFRPPMIAALLIWAGGAAISLVAALLALRIRPRFTQGWAVLRERHGTSEVSALATVSSSLATYATLGMATVALTAAAAGSLRGASTVMAPVNTFFAFVGLALLPAAYRTAPSRQVRFVVLTSMLLIGLTVAWGAVLLVVPADVGRLVLGASWVGARSVLPWTVIEYLGLAVIAGVALGFQVRKQARLLGIVSLAEAGTVVVAAALASTFASSASSFAAAIAIAAVVNAVGASVIYVVSTRRLGTEAGGATLRRHPGGSGQDA